MPAKVETFLDRDRNAVQRPGDAAGSAGSVGRVGLLERLFEAPDHDRVDVAIQPLDARDIGLRDLARAVEAFGEVGGNLGRAVEYCGHDVQSADRPEALTISAFFLISSAMKRSRYSGERRSGATALAPTCLSPS